MKKHLALGLVALSMGFASCEKDDDSDTTKPVITINTPTNEQQFEPGDSFDLTGSITDNEALSSFKVDIHHGGDHDHGRIASEWTYEKTWEITGTSYSVNETITIPADIEHGEYHLLVYATDKEGNEAEFVQLNLDIE